MSASETPLFDTLLKSLSHPHNIAAVKQADDQTKRNWVSTCHLAGELLAHRPISEREHVAGWIERSVQLGRIEDAMIPDPFAENTQDATVNENAASIVDYMKLNAREMNNALSVALMGYEKGVVYD